MGHGASVPRALLPAQTQALALSRVVVARALSAAQRAERLRAAANAHAERLVLARARRAAAQTEAASKRWFVRSVSTTSAAAAFAFDLRECVVPYLQSSIAGIAERAAAVSARCVSPSADTKCTHVGQS